ncbi:MAG: MlaE family ABC transporter permease [Deferrisomatales bacterium]
MVLDGRGIEAWDSLLAARLHRLLEAARDAGVREDFSTLPKGLQRLLGLASPAHSAEPHRRGVRSTLLLVVGSHSLRIWGEIVEMLQFLGEVTQSLGRFARGRARFRRQDLFLFLQQAGAEAFPVVSLISVLVGMILGFVGAVQLRLFGAQVYLADMVGIGMVREMGAMMTGIIIAGRTGSSFAAQLGSMQANEEIDALRTLGIDPVDFLVLPRGLALVVMLPLLCVYADFMGVLGGALVGVGNFDVPLAEYIERTRQAVPIRHFWVGVSKSAIYGGVVAFAGCMHGMQCGRSASAVGRATTSAVVSGIVGIIVWCAITTILYQVLGI